MITVWNRKELFCTFDMKKQAEVRDILWKFDMRCAFLIGRIFL